MDRGRDKPPKGPGESRNPKGTRDPKASETSTAADPTAPGSVPVDQRGRNVWHFHGESIDSTSMMLQRLDNPSLALEPTRKTKRLDSDASKTPGKQATGKNPATPATAGKAEPAATKGLSGARKGVHGPTRGPGAAQRVEDDDSHQSFEQSFSVKPGKGSGGGFDPYNNS